MTELQELYRAWRTVQEQRDTYQASQRQLEQLSRGCQGLVEVIEADGYRWRIAVGYGPRPTVLVQAIDRAPWAP